MKANHDVPCIVYAAKSTEDPRGSIPDQLRECRAEIIREAGRAVVAEYTDEAFSAYRSSRGPGLVEAMQHAEELAQEGTIELWAQHSDRLARGDGRSARHAVEIALWALKNDVRVRTLQDPDTFRDLLYAVVTGQRNHEDSRRKGLASAAGRRRAVERGEYTGTHPDGYRRVVEVDKAGTITKRMDIDPARREMIEMMFRLALRGRRNAAIARALNEAGWRTKPLITTQQPRAWDVEGVRRLLVNPRYAGLSTDKGEVLGRGDWPVYITERQHHRLKARLSLPRPTKTRRQPEPYLFARLARCGYCASSLHCHTFDQREDGTWCRCYICYRHKRGGNGGPWCPAPPIDADVVEAMFVAAVRTLLLEGADGELGPTAESGPLEGSWSDSPERQRVLEAVAAGDDARIDAALEALLTRMVPEVATLRHVAASSRHARRLEVAKKLETWATEEREGRTDASRERTRELNRVLRAWFATVSLAMDGLSVTIVAHRRPAGGADGTSVRVEARFARRDSTQFLPFSRRAKRSYRLWDQSAIVAELRAWADAHGRSPRPVDWTYANAQRPSSQTVLRHFKTWGRALKHAGLDPLGPEYVHRWEDRDILEALRRWSKQHGRRATRAEWTRSGRGRPSKNTVCAHFGSWGAALAAAGVLEVEPPSRPVSATTASRPETRR